MATKAKAAALPARIKVERTHIYEGQETTTVAEDDQIMVGLFQTSTASVSVKKGFTKNMGNYESVRVDVMITCPCYKEEIDPVYEEVDAVVDEMVEEQIRAITNG